MSKILVIGLLIILILGVGFFVNSSSKKEPADTKETKEEVNYKAHFVIFTNGTLRDFSSPQYHNQSEKVFISNDNPMAVNVKAAGITWDDFFNTLPMKLTKECLTTGTGQVFCTNETGTLKFFLNGKLENDLLLKEIKNGDRLLITYGNENNEEIQNQLKLLE